MGVCYGTPTHRYYRERVCGCVCAMARIYPTGDVGRSVYSFIPTYSEREVWVPWHPYDGWGDVSRDLRVPDGVVSSRVALLGTLVPPCLCSRERGMAIEGSHVCVVE